MGQPIDLTELAGRLGRAFPSLVTLSNGASVTTVMGRVKVASNGMVEGAGPAAERVRAICEEYIGEQPFARRGPNSAPQKVATNTRNPFRCQHCGLRLTAGRVYRRTMGGSVLLFCCKGCADHHEKGC